MSTEKERVLEETTRLRGFVGSDTAYTTSSPK